MLVVESAKGLNYRLEQWREALEDNGLRVSREKTEYMRYDFRRDVTAQYEEVDIRIGDQILQPKESFRYLGWTYGKTMLDMIPNGVFRTLLEVETIISKMRKGNKRWCGHVRRRPQQAPIRRFEALIVDGKRRRDRPKLRWDDRLKLDIKELLLSEDMTSDEMRGEIGLVYACRSD
ncbi:hypothetical protein Tco_1165282 [Tanacetum coccineum]